MNKQLPLLLMFVMALLAVGVTAYFVGRSSVSPVQLLSVPAEERDFEGDYAKTEFPLLEYYFPDDSQWLFIIEKWNDKGSADYLIMTDPDALTEYQTEISIRTYPAGRGTTSAGHVYLYKDGVLLRDLQFLEVLLSKNVKKADLHPVPYTKIQQLIKGDLPPAD